MKIEQLTCSIGAELIDVSLEDAAYDNGLKTAVSETCLHVAREALTVCGFAGYARTGDFSVSRHVRDLTSAPLMIGNSRMREADTTVQSVQAFSFTCAK